ncbi:hypothetical protein WA158_004859 [Blastocystis sp. Blastoise]
MLQLTTYKVTDEVPKKNLKLSKREYMKQFESYFVDDFHFQEFNRFYNWDYKRMQHFVDPKHVSFISFLNYYKDVQRRCEKNYTQRNIIVFEPTFSGLGNKLLGLSLAFYFAMMTNSRFMICNWPAFSYYFDFLMPISIVSCNQLNITKTISYTSPCKNHEEVVFPRLSTMFNSSITKITVNCGVIRRIHEGNNIKSFFRLYNMESDSSRHSDYATYLIYRFFKNVISPSKYVQQSIDDKWYYLSNTDVIGIHLRFGKYADFNKTKDKNDHFLYPSDLKYVMSVAKRYTYKLYPRDVRWYISSDSTYYKNKMKEEYPYEVIIFNTTIVHSGLVSLDNQSLGVIDSISEMYLLSKCKYIIRYAGSSFSYLSCAMRDGVRCASLYRNSLTNRITSKETS